MKVESFKVVVTSPDQSEQIQELCFKNGIYWFSFGFNKYSIKIKETDQPFLYIEEYINYDSCTSTFSKKELPSLTFEQAVNRLKYSLPQEREMTYDETVDFILANPDYHIKDEYVWRKFSSSVFNEESGSINILSIKSLTWRRHRRDPWKKFTTTQDV